MLTEVQKYIAACDICQKYKSTNSKPSGLLVPLEVPKAKFQSWSMDFITSLPEVKIDQQTFSVIFTVVDRLTKFVVLIPVFLGEQKLTAAEVARLFLVI